MKSSWLFSHGQPHLSEAAQLHADVLKVDGWPPAAGNRARESRRSAQLRAERHKNMRAKWPDAYKRMMG